MVAWARLQQGQVLGVTVLIVGALALLVCLALILDLLLAEQGRAKDIASIIQSFAASLAILAGGIYALYKLQVFRTLEPHMTIAHRVSHRRIGDSYVHIDVTASLYNSSKVKLELREGFFLLQQVAPVSDRDVEALYTETFEDRRFDNIQWPTLEEAAGTWEEGELVVEPGESHAETLEFIVPADVGSVLIYTYFYNHTAARSPGAAEGWAATTVHDIIEAPVKARG